MTEKSQDNNPSRLYRSETNRIIAGVCGGLGDYFNIDPTILRVIFILLTVFGGSGILIYIILWIVIPSESKMGTISSEQIRENVKEMKERAKSIAHDFRSRNHENSRFWWAILIIVLGFMFLFNNFGIFDVFEIRKLWPLVLIILGLSLIFKK